MQLNLFIERQDAFLLDNVDSSLTIRFSEKDHISIHLRDRDIKKRSQLSISNNAPNPKGQFWYLLVNFMPGEYTRKVYFSVSHMWLGRQNLQGVPKVRSSTLIFVCISLRLDLVSKSFSQKLCLSI